MASTARRDERRREREAEEEAERLQYWDRFHGLWNVPERAKHEYLMMEDDFSPSTVLDFVKAMSPEEEPA
jgi:hypothetical protein